MKKFVFSFLLLTTADILFGQENTAPVVKIISPLNKTAVALNESVHYRIKVSDQEDGESDYNEIASNEIFLEVRYVNDVAQIQHIAFEADPKGLASIKKSNCFTCHAFHGKMIAPSFFEIATRYPLQQPLVEALASKIINGSSSVWGNATMPSHEELTPAEAKEMAAWILKNGTDVSVNYYSGADGTIKLKASEPVAAKGAFILNATYTDHGAKNNPNQTITSGDKIILNVK